jgi:hypothetical protein
MWARWLLVLTGRGADRCPARIPLGMGWGVAERLGATP